MSREKVTVYRMAQFIEYRAQWAGVLVFRIDEAWTSKICHSCGSIGKRTHQGLSACDCGLEYNADLNGAINVARRFLEQVLKNSAPDKPLNLDCETMQLIHRRIPRLKSSE